MQPVAPPITSAPIAPPNNPVPMTTAIVNANPVDQIEQAVINRDINSLDNFAKSWQNDDVQKVAMNMKQNAIKGEQEAAAFFSEIDKAKTQEERNQAALKTYQTAKDNPQYGTALMMYMAGDKIGGMQMISGGKVETKYEYLQSTGKFVTKKVNALGEIVSVTDQESKNVIPLDEYAKLGGSVSAYENTLKGMSDIETNKTNTTLFNQATNAHNNLTVLANAKQPLVTTYRQIADNLIKNPQLNMNDLIDLAKVSSAQMSVAQSLQRGRQFLKSFNETKGTNLTTESLNKLGLSAGNVSEIALKAGLKGDLGATITDTSGNTYTASDLLQSIENVNIGSQFDRNFSQTQDARKEAAILELYKDNPVLYNQLRQFFETGKQIQILSAEGSEKFGNPLFTVPSTAAAFVDPMQKMIASSIQEQFNIDVTKKFNEYRENILTQAKEDGANSWIPKPGEIEKAFTRTPWYKTHQKEASKQIVQAINQASIYSKRDNVSNNMQDTNIEGKNAIKPPENKNPDPSEVSKKQSEIREKEQNKKPNPLEEIRKKYAPKAGK